MHELKPLQIVIPKELIEILKEQKKIQRLPVSRIVEQLIEEKYATTSYKLKKLND